MSNETFNNLLKNSNALFDRDNKIWSKESLLIKIKKSVLPEIR